MPPRSTRTKLADTRAGREYERATSTDTERAPPVAGSPPPSCAVMVKLSVWSMLAASDTAVRTVPAESTVKLDACVPVSA